MTQKKHDRSGSEQLKKAMREMQGYSVQVGWLDGAKYPPDAKRHRKGGTPIAMVAYWLNNGTPHMPARPFFSEAVAANQTAIKNMIKNAAMAVFNGQMTAEQALGQVGLFLESKIIENIKSQKYAALSEDYFKWKQQFHNSPQTLIDTAAMWQDVMNKVVKDASTG